MALQHLRSSTANKRPTPAAMSDGQLAMNTNSGSPGLFLKDSSGALVKVGPVHVGATAPNASPASGGQSGNTVGEQWLDISGSTYVFKIWDGSAWRSEAGEFVNVAGDVMTGALGIIAGSAASPGVYFSGDTNTGIYSPGADQVAISTNGTGRLFVDASGRVLAGTDTAIPQGTNVGFGRLQVLGTSSTQELLGRFSADASAAVFAFLKSRNATIGSHTIVNSGDTLGQINFQGSDGTDYLNAALIRAEVDGTPGTNDMPGRLVFSTTADGASSPTERMRIASDGNVYLGSYLAPQIGATSAALQVPGSISLNGVNTFGSAGITASLLFHHRTTANTNGQIAGKIESASTNTYTNGVPSTYDADIVTYSAENGVNVEVLRATSNKYLRMAAGTGGIQFNGNTAAANALDDYEEGTFTPTIVGTSTAGTATYAANGQVGRYTKIGNRVFFDLYLSWTAHTGTGDLQINGLPFTVQNTTNLNRNYSAILNVVAMTAGNLGAAFSSPNTTAVALRQMPTGGGSVATIPMDTSAQISISGCFEA
jgi:hypothetical protein